MMFRKTIRKNHFYLLLILTGLSVLPVLFVGALSVGSFNHYVGKQLRDTYKARLQQLQADLEIKNDEINNAVTILIMASAHLELDSIYAENISEFETIDLVYRVWDLMDTIKQSSRFIHSLYYIKADKSFLISSEREAVTLSKARDIQWVDSISQDTNFLELPPREIPGDPGSSVITRVFGTRAFVTNADGYFAVNLDLNEFSAWISSINDNQDSDVFVFNPQGLYISGSDLDTALPALFIPESGNLYKGNLYFKIISESGWEYILRVPSQFLNSFLNRTILIMFFMTVLLFILAFVFSVYVSKRLYSPIESIIGIIEEGEDRVPDNRSEISFIGDIFLKMAKEQVGLKDVLEQNRQAIKESMLRRLFLGDPVDHSLILKHLSEDFEAGLYCSAVILLLPKGTDLSVSDSGPAQAMAVSAYEAESTDNIRILGGPLDMERIALLISAKDSLSIKNSLLHVRTFLESSLSMEPLVAVGGLYPSITDIEDSFSEAIALLDSTIPDENEQIIFHEESPQVLALVPGTKGYPWAIESQLIQGLKQADRKRVSRLVSEFLQDVSREGFSDRDRVEMSILTLITAVMRAMGLDRIFSDEAHPGNLYRDFLNHDQSIKNAEQWLNTFMEYYLDVSEVKDSREEKYRIMIQDYIQENLSKDISLEHIADWMGISYSYLRKIFSTLFGVTFLEYIHSIRIEKAKDLLRDSNNSISDIARSVGYINTSRLNRNFNKVIGCTPSEYRTRVRKSLIE